MDFRNARVSAAMLRDAFIHANFSVVCTHTHARTFFVLRAKPPTCMQSAVPYIPSGTSRVRDLLELIGDRTARAIPSANHLAAGAHRTVVVSADVVVRQPGARRRSWQE